MNIDKRILDLQKKCNYQFKNYDFKLKYIHKIKKSDADLTIIIPCYNTGKYLFQCVKSCMNQQTSFRYNVIVVNDGSTDDTLKVLKKLKKIDKKNLLTIINTENGGVARARNIALNMPLGKYVMFVDSDDSISRNSLQVLLEESDGFLYDIVEGSYYNYNEIFWIKVKKFMKHKAGVYQNFKRAKLTGYPWGKIIKRELFENIYFPVGLWYEDTIITYLIYPKASKIKTIPNVIYERRMSDTSITRNAKNILKRADNFWVLYEIFEYIDTFQTVDKDILYEQTVYQLGIMYKLRNSILDNNVRKLIFDASCYLFTNEYPKAKNISDTLLSNLDKCLRNKDFNEFERILKIK